MASYLVVVQSRTANYSKQCPLHAHYVPRPGQYSKAHPAPPPLFALMLVTFARLSALRALRTIHKLPQIKKFIDSFHTTIFFSVCVCVSFR